MRNPLLLKGGFILTILAIALWLFIPPQERIALGLDLKGGIHLVMEVETDDAVKAEADQAEERLRQELRSRGITSEKVSREGLAVLLISGALPAERDALRQVFDEQLPGWNPVGEGQGIWRPGSWPSSNI